MRKCGVALLALLMLLVAGCSGGAGSAPPAVEWTKDAGTVVFQIDSGGGFVPPFEHVTDIPELTVFGDGTVVTVRFEDDGTRRVVAGKLAEAELARLLGLAEQEMNGLKAEYDAPVEDAGATRFALVTAKGTRKVSAVAFSIEDVEQLQVDTDAYKRLRKVNKAFYDALPKEMAPYTPEKVILMTEALPPENVAGELLPWPAELTPLPVPPAGNAFGHVEAEVTGAAAKALAEAIPYRTPFSRLYKQGDAFYLVAVKPVLPNLFAQG